MDPDFATLLGNVLQHGSHVGLIVALFVAYKAGITATKAVKLLDDINTKIGAGTEAVLRYGPVLEQKLEAVHDDIGRLPLELVKLSMLRKQ